MTAEPQMRTGFDMQERERVRRALRRYMQENRIGSPTLQYRIIEADKPRRREIPLATLQRFLRGSHHTHDHHVALCHAFVSPLPYYGEGRDLEAFGAALTGFLREPADAESGDQLAGRLEHEFARHYVTRTKAIAPGAFPFPPEAGLIASRVSFDHAPGQGWLKVREFVTDSRNSAENPQRRFTYDGVLLLTPPLVFVFLRNTLTRQPKTYSLAQVFTQAAEGKVILLEGEGCETWFLRDDPAQRLNQNFRVQFVPAAEDGAEP
jgi:hypothetical protein